MQSLKKIHAWAQMQVPLYPFSHQSDTFASFFLSDYVFRYQILQNTQISLLPLDKSDPG